MKTCNNCTHCDIKFALCKLDYKVRPARDASGKIYTPRGCPKNKLAPQRLEPEQGQKIIKNEK